MLKAIHLFLIMIAAAFPAARALTVESTPGALHSLVSEPATTTELVVTGAMDVRDFDFIRSELPLLRSLDLSRAGIEHYEGEPTFTGRTASDESVLPEGALMMPSLTELALPEGLRAIADGALATTSIESLRLPATLTSIGHSAMAGCSRLKSVEIPPSVTTMGHGVFADCSALTSVTVGSGLTALPASTFARCTSLASVLLPAGIRSIGDEAFNGCAALAAVELPAALTEIGRLAFANSGLTLLDVARCSHLASIGPWAFTNCVSLTAVTLSASLVELGCGAFYNATNAALAPLPESLQALPDYALAGTATADAKIIANTSVAHIGDFAMADMQNMASVILPSALESIGRGAMANWTSLQFIDATAAGVVPSLGTEVWKGVDAPSVTLNVPPDMIEAFSKADQWADFNIVSYPSGMESLFAEAPDSGIKAWFDAQTLHIEAPGEIVSVRIADITGRIFTIPMASGAISAQIDTAAWPATRVLIVSITLADTTTATLKLLR